MFQLTKEEWGILMSQFAISSWGGTRKLPYAFTEQGVAMLSGLLYDPAGVEYLQRCTTPTELRDVDVSTYPVLRYACTGLTANPFSV